MAEGKTMLEVTKLYGTVFYKSGKWIIEIISHGDDFEFWIGYENYGIFDMCFGASLKDTSAAEFMDLVEANLYREKIRFAYEHDEDEFEI